MKEKNQKFGFYKFFVLSKSTSKQKVMSIDQFLLELLNFKGEIWHISNCIENPIHLEIGPNFKKQYLERIQRYLHSVKSNDSI